MDGEVVGLSWGGKRGGMCIVCPGNGDLGGIISLLEALFEEQRKLSAERSLVGKRYI